MMVVCSSCGRRAIAHVLQELCLIAQPHPVMRVGHGRPGSFQGHLLVPVLEGEGGAVDEEDEDRQAEDPRRAYMPISRSLRPRGVCTRSPSPRPPPLWGRGRSTCAGKLAKSHGDGLQLGPPRQRRPPSSRLFLPTLLSSSDLAVLLLRRTPSSRSAEELP